jgi:hypothetical protein
MREWYEADFPELRADCWATRAHRGPADFFPHEWREFVGSVAAFELVRNFEAFSPSVTSGPASPRYSLMAFKTLED